MDGACGKSHTVLITSDGDAYAFGSNKHGQLGVGAIAKKPKGSDDLRPAPVQCTGVSGATARAPAAPKFTAWICGDGGAVYTAGLPQYGQLGHGTDHEYNMASSSVKIAVTTSRSRYVAQRRRAGGCPNDKNRVRTKPLRVGGRRRQNLDPGQRRVRAAGPQGAER